jgi:hypothetical protein
LLAQALWRQAGQVETRQVVDWFYDDAALRGIYDGRDAFWRRFFKTPKPDDVELIRAVIADPRLDRLGWRDLEAVVRAANQFTRMPLVTWEEFRDASFVTMDFSYANLEESERTIPSKPRRSWSGCSSGVRAAGRVPLPLRQGSLVFSCHPLRSTPFHPPQTLY